jgi:diguanylate cyclase (GGDEF)-like protein
MSLDLYEKETSERINSLQPTEAPETGAFDGFLRGSAMYTMRGFAKAGRAVDMLGAVGPIVQDFFTGGTEAQDKYFQEHDDVFNSAVDYWTPKPGEVGIAGEVVGTLLSTLPVVVASPSLAVAETQLATSEDLTREGVSAGKAQAVGAVQGLGLGLGIYMPILGKNLWQRTLIGGAGFNVIQGAVTRSASGEILKGTQAEGDYAAFDPNAMTLDFLLGLGFGAISHLSPTQRAQGERAWEKMTEWGKSVSPSDMEALATLRQAQHSNVDSLPGKPADVEDVSAHVDRIKKAADQLLRDEPVEVSDMPSGKFEPIPERFEEAKARADALMSEAEKVRVEEGLPPVDRRSDTETRKRISEMTPEELKQELLTHELSGIPNKRAYQDSQKLPVQIAVDADSLKWINDNMGHGAGDELLKSIAKALHEESGNAFHLSGDEFALQAKTPADADEIMGRVNQRLKSATVEGIGPDGTIYRKTGLEISYGKGSSLEEADQGLQRSKSKRGAEGHRSPRGAEPPGVARVAPKGGEANQRSASAQSLVSTEAQRFASENPDVPITVGQDADGNPITKTIREYLDEARSEADSMRQDAGLFKIAAECMLGVF